MENYWNYCIVFGSLSALMLVPGSHSCLSQVGPTAIHSPAVMTSSRYAIKAIPKYDISNIPVDSDDENIVSKMVKLNGNENVTRDFEDGNSVAERLAPPPNASIFTSKQNKPIVSSNDNQSVVWNHYGSDSSPDTAGSIDEKVATLDHGSTNSFDDAKEHADVSVELVDDTKGSLHVSFESIDEPGLFDGPTVSVDGSAGVPIESADDVTMVADGNSVAERLAPNAAISKNDNQSVIWNDYGSDSSPDTAVSIDEKVETLDDGSTNSFDDAQEHANVSIELVDDTKESLRGSSEYIDEPGLFDDVSVDGSAGVRIESAGDVTRSTINSVVSDYESRGSFDAGLGFFDDMSGQGVPVLDANGSTQNESASEATMVSEEKQSPISKHDHEPQVIITSVPDFIDCKPFSKSSHFIFLVDKSLNDSEITATTSMTTQLRQRLSNTFLVNTISVNLKDIEKAHQLMERRFMIYRTKRQVVFPIFGPKNVPETFFDSPEFAVRPKLYLWIAPDQQITTLTTSEGLNAGLKSVSHQLCSQNKLTKGQ